MEQARFHYDNLFYVSPLLCGSFSICQIGDLSCGLRHTVQEHNQECYELSLILSGDAVFWISGEAVRARAGDLVLNRPGDIHLIESDDAYPVRYLYVGFSFRDESYTAVRRAFDAASVRVTADCGELAVLFFSIFSELEQDSEYRLPMIAAYLTELVVKSYRRFLGQENQRYAPVIPARSAEDTLYAIIRRLDSSQLRLEHLSLIGDDFGYSYAYLSQLFSKRMGMSISEYFQMRLFGRAVSLLENGVSVTETAEQLGYRSIHTFSRAFSRYYGVAPSRYLAARRQPETDR